MMKMLNAMMFKAQAKLRSFFTKEDGAVDIVAIVVIIGIAVILALAFKDEITQILTDIFGNIGNRVGEIDKDVSFGS